MSDERQTDAGEPAEGAEFDLPIAPEGESSERRLRRGIFGYRPDDVAAAISSRDTTIRELRRDVTALWLAFGQHERTIKLLVEAIEAEGGPRLEPPGGRAQPDHGDAPHGDAPARPEPSRSEPAYPSEEPLAGEAIAEQLAGLDEVLAAIESATQSLEQAYADEITAAREGPETGEAAGGERAEDAGESPDGGDTGGAEDAVESSGSGDAEVAGSRVEPGDEESR